MKSLRRVRPAFLIPCLAVGLSLQAAAQTAPQTQNPPSQPQTQPAQPRRQSPFENVPQAPVTPAPQPAPGQPAAPSETAQPQAAPAEPAPQLPDQLAGQNIEGIDFVGSRRIPQDTLRAMIVTKQGDPYNPDMLRRDFMQLWNSGRFDDIRVEVEPGKVGLIVRFLVTERRVIRTIDYQGVKSATTSDILDYFKERRVGLTVESQYDPAKVQRAVVALKELLGQRGRQYAIVEPIIEQLPPSSLKVVFRVTEGPKVKVGKIEFDGNAAFSDRYLVRKMKQLRPIGVPHSILFENIFAKTFDTMKLESDKEDVRQAYLNEGYFQARILDEKVQILRTGGHGWRIPLFHMNLTGITANIRIPVEEGQQYRIRDINFVGVKLFKTPEALMAPLFRMGKGDVLSAEKLRKGMEAMRTWYGSMGFIDFVPEPDFNFDRATSQVDLTITADEGKQFFVRRIDFAGNTTTRDKVIRRELMLDEGDPYNTQLWEASILRLNQLGYFEMLKKEDAADIKRNSQSNTVDITLKVKERGKNSVGMNGGVSGIAGSFLGFNYSTNNFLGLGETLSIDSQIGTRSRDVSFGFTEPYLFDRPIQTGFVVYLRRFNFDQGREASILAGANLIPLYNQLGAQNLLNYSQNSTGFSLSLSTHLRRSFAQVGLTYGFENSSIVTDTTAAKNYFEYVNFTGVEGPSQLQGIRTSKITPSYAYNTVNHPISPNAGKSIYFSVEFAGSVLGGNVNTIRPTLDVKYFKQSPWFRSHVLAFHGMASTILGYGGKSIPPFSRTFIGGEQDIRGFEIWGITPISFIPSSADVPVWNANGTARTQKVIEDGKLVDKQVTMKIPIYQFTTPGGDTQVIGNFEYRIPIMGPVTLAAFLDAGINKILLTNQLKMIPSRVADLNAQFPQAGFDGRVRIAPGTQKMRASTGLELNVMLPIVQAPFRLYFAYNPSILRTTLQTPIVVDRAAFPNQVTFAQSVASFGQAFPWLERRTSFRFSIGKTF